MRKILFSALAMVAFAGSAFASNEVVVENLSNDKQEQTTPCRWRTVYTHSDGTKSYGPWTYGNCNTVVHPDGTKELKPIKAATHELSPTAP